MAKRALSFLVKVVITGGMFAVLFWPEKFGLSADQFRGVKPADLLRELSQVETHNILLWLCLAAMMRILGMLCGILRWRLLLLAQGLKIPFLYLTRSWFIGRAIGIFLPGTLGLDGYRLFDSSRYTGDVIKSTTVIAVEKLTGFIALTFLVFVTFPLGFRMFDMKLPVLLGILAVLGTFVVVSFVALLNPRVIQVAVAVLPTPGKIRSKFDRIGAAVSAYSGNRAQLVLAVGLGICVHFATCLVFFCTMTAIRAQNTTMSDILFATPLMIYGTVLGPSVGGEGIREIIYVALLSTKSGAAASLLMAHLGWWAGDVVPFVIGTAVYLFGKKPNREEIQSRMAAARAEVNATDVSLHLSTDEIRTYRGNLIDCAVAGIAAGLLSGAFIGLGEAGWLAHRLQGLEEVNLFWWGPLVYGLLFAGMGLGVAGALAFLALVRDRFPRAVWTLALSTWGTMFVGIVVIGRFRIFRDVLGEHPLSMNQNLQLLGAAAGIGLVVAVVFALLFAVLGSSRVRMAVVALLIYGLLVAGGAVAASRYVHTSNAPVLADKKPTGPNIILVAVDTLRADYLKVYSGDAAVAKTPAVDAFRSDAVLFRHTFAQSSWTKASFATIFSGLYPETHSAVHKDSMLPSAVTTFPEVLHEAGYFTQGFPNNPNIADAYNYGQGFTEYTYLKPRLLLGATESVDKLALYQVVRRVYQKFVDKLTGGKLNVMDFYQPAEVVTDKALDWVAGEQRPKDRPFLLFLHYMDPHDPYMDHENPGKGYARARMPNPDPEKYLDEFKKLYNGEIEYFDQHFGRLVEGLKSQGVYDNSVIVFVADHGEEFYEHQGWWHGLSLYDEQIAVPLIIKLPGNNLSGSETSGLSRLVDIAPTLLQTAGLPKIEAMQGESLFTVDQSSLAPSAPSYVYGHLDFEGILLRSVRTMTEKLVLANPENKRKYQPVELYDLVADPGEKTNIAGQGKEFEKTLSDTVAGMQEFVKGGAVPPEFNTDDTDNRQQLKDIGYLN
ncbi:MAG: sulfatase-like hydrolase/transferase [Candidatus Hydrogenedentes bacterium]|nr:sulfatase-like hydrolase/transferase [Candidatus Hydrogenedentota bacterium]